MAEKELEDELMKAGNKLLEPPSSVEEVLALLNEVEGYLSKVQQSPSKSMQDALCYPMKALVTEKLLRHLDMDVKVSVACCISEITRITAPEAPYDDDQMKEVFNLFVEAFENLFDTSCDSYSKRVSILETVAKVRSCVVMLDLECDTLIVQMFQNFIKSIRDSHPDKVFSSMETIMTLVLEESEDISVELLSPLLTSVQKDKDVLPIARKLAEKVLGNCTDKLKLYLMQAVESMGMSVEDYTKVVASICQGESDTIEDNDVNSSDEQLEDEIKVVEMAGSDEPPQVPEEVKSEVVCTEEIAPDVEETPTLVKSNGSAEINNNDSLVGLDSPKKNLELSPSTTQVAEAEPDSLDSPKEVKSEDKPNQTTNKRKGRKPNSSTQSAEASGPSQIESGKETVDLPLMRKSGSKEANNLNSQDPSVDEATVPSVHGKEILTEVDETLKVGSPSSNDGTHSKGRRGRKKKENTNQDTDSGLPSESKGALLIDKIEDEAPPSADVLKKEPEGNIEMEAKPHRRSSKKASSAKVNEYNTPSPLKKGSGATSDSEAKRRKRSGKKVDERRKPLSGGKTISKKVVIGESSNKKVVSSPKPAAKSIIKDEITKTKSKRKRTPGKEETSGTPYSVEDLGENLVGSKMKVWWPRDQTFYEGIVDSFDPVRMKHKILYTDGDVEILTLKKERWELVKETMEDVEQATDLPSPDVATSDMPKIKKAKTNPVSPTKQAKTDTSSKRGKGTSASKSKGEATKSVGKLKVDSILGSGSTDGSAKIKNAITGKSKDKMKDDTQRTATKSKDDTPKSAIKSKDDTSKSATKSKDDTPKIGTKSSKDDTTKINSKSKNDTSNTGTKSKGETLKTNKKSSVNGSSSKGKTGTSKVQESEEDLAKEKFSESDKVSGKKRARKFSG